MAIETDVDATREDVMRMRWDEPSNRAVIDYLCKLADRVSGRDGHDQPIRNEEIVKALMMAEGRIPADD